MYTKIINVNGKEMVDRPVACAMFAMDKEDVIMVKQDRGTFGKIYEIPAGKMEDRRTNGNSNERI